MLHCILYEGKIILCRRIPDASAVKQKMLYSGSKSALLAAIGTGLTINATDMSELTVEALETAANKV